MWHFGRRRTFQVLNMTNLKRWVLEILSFHHIRKEKEGEYFKRCQIQLISQINDREGRFVLVKGKIDQKEVTIFNVYALPGSNITVFRRIFELITSQTYGTLICAGEFNILLNPSLDTTNRIRRRNLIEKRINKVLKDLGLIDVWRALNGSTPGYTFYSARHTAYSRIDYFFMYNKDLHRLKHCRIGQRDLS